MEKEVCSSLVILFMVLDNCIFGINENPVSLEFDSCGPSVISMDGLWDFNYLPSPIKAGDALALPKDQEFKASMIVPGYWDDNLDKLQSTYFWSNAKFNPNYRPIDYPMGYNPPSTTLPYLVGTGYYRKYFEAPAEWRQQVVTLHIGGVCAQAWIWLNGNLLKHQVGYETPFEVPLNPLLITGKNELVIAVDNALSTGHFGCDRWGYTGYTGGIYRSVHLEITGSPRISDIYLHPLESTRNIRWNVAFGNFAKSEPAVLRWLIRNPEDDGILGQGEQEIPAETLSWDTGNFGMKEWSEHTPYLYELELSVWKENILVDRKIQSFGLRKLEQKGIKLYLNNRPVMLRGTCEVAYYPLTCTPPVDVESYRRIIRTYKKLGFNWLRFHTTVPHEEYLQAADELGMMVQVEATVENNSTEYDAEWLKILHACRKHPSVVLYCPGNEQTLVWPTVERVVRWGQICRREAPDALYNPMEFLHEVTVGVTTDAEKHKAKYADAEKFDPAEILLEPFPHNAAKLKRLQEVANVFSPKAPDSTLSLNSVNWNPASCDLFRIFDRPLLMHEFGIQGAYLNLDLEHRYADTRIGTALYASVRRNLQKEGLLPKAALYYRNSCKLQEVIRKNSIENGRKCEYIAGYDFLGGIDAHWHRTGYDCGVMNEFYELKPGQSVPAINMYNAESVILLEIGNYRNLVMGDRFTADMLSSLYGNAPLEEGFLTWCLKDSRGNLWVRGDARVEDVAYGRIGKLATIDFVVPQRDAPAQVKLVAHLSGAEYEIDNQWNLWVFPKVDEIPVSMSAEETIVNAFGAYCPRMKKAEPDDQQSLRVVSALDSETLEFLAQGGNVLMLGADSFPKRKMEFQIVPAGRVLGNAATVIADHPLLRKFPHDGFCDWQFYSLLEGAEPVNFNDFDISFSPILEVVSSYKLILKQAGIFELSVGNGKLLVCTLNIKPSDPAGMFLFKEMLEYVSGENFRPNILVTPHVLASMLNKEFQDHTK